MDFWTRIYTTYFFASSAVLVCFGAIICLLTAPFDPRRRLLQKYACWWGYHYIQMNPGWTCRFHGLEKIQEDKTYVLAANHQSYWDIMVLYGLHRSFKWVSKAEIFKIPFVGWNMMLNQYVAIARSDLKSIKDMMNDCQKWLKQGVSIMIFPEGTRSDDGNLQEFRDGPFKMAMVAGVPVVPIVVTGTREILPKGKWTLKFKHSIDVYVLDPVEPTEFGRNVKAYRDHVRDLMVERLESARLEKSASGCDEHRAHA